MEVSRPEVSGRGQVVVRLAIAALGCGEAAVPDLHLGECEQRQAESVERAAAAVRRYQLLEEFPLGLDVPQFVARDADHDAEGVLLPELVGGAQPGEGRGQGRGSLGVSVGDGASQCRHERIGAPGRQFAVAPGVGGGLGDLVGCRSGDHAATDDRGPDRFAQQVPARHRIGGAKVGHRLQQHRGHLTRAGPDHLDGRPQPCRVDAGFRSRQVGTGEFDQRLYLCEIAGGEVGRRRVEVALGPLARMRGHLRRPGEDQGLFGVSATGLGQLGGGFELRRHAVVRAVGRFRPVPGPAFGGTRGGQRRLDTPPFLDGRGRVDRRPDQRVAEGDGGSAGQYPGVDSGHGRPCR